jgi:hypothetical protein
MERRTDMYISTPQHFVRVMGGELKITAVFPEGGKMREERSRSSSSIKERTPRRQARRTGAG